MKIFVAIVIAIHVSRRGASQVELEVTASRQESSASCRETCLSSMKATKTVEKKYLEEIEAMRKELAELKLLTNQLAAAQVALRRPDPGAEGVDGRQPDGTTPPGDDIKNNDGGGDDDNKNLPPGGVFFRGSYFYVVLEADFKRQREFYSSHWVVGQRKCMDHGGDLAVLDTREKLDAIRPLKLGKRLNVSLDSDGCSSWSNSKCFEVTQEYQPRRFWVGANNPFVGYHPIYYPGWMDREQRNHLWMWLTGKRLPLSFEGWRGKPKGETGTCVTYDAYFNEQDSQSEGLTESTCNSRWVMGAICENKRSVCESKNSN